MQALGLYKKMLIHVWETHAMSHYRESNMSLEIVEKCSPKKAIKHAVSDIKIKGHVPEEPTGFACHGLIRLGAFQL